MKVINLNSFKQSSLVELDGVQYSVGTMSIGMAINANSFKPSESFNVEEQREALMSFVDAIVGVSDIPREVLINQPFTVLTAIMQIAQGADLTNNLSEDGQ